MARTAPEMGKAGRKPASRASKPAMSPGRQRLWRDLALIAVAPLLLFLLACLVTYSPADPGFSSSGSITAPVHNACGRVGAWIADVLLMLTGYVAFLLPVVLGAIAWIALFGMDSDGDGDADLGPALRLIGIVGFLVSATGLLALRVAGSHDLPEGSGGVVGQLIGNSLGMLFGALGANLFLLSLFLISVTLATGLSWLAVMDRIGGWVLAPIASHTLSNRPIVLPDDTEVAIEIVAGLDASVNFDMQSLASLLPGDRIRVRRSQHRVHFLHPRGWSYYATLRRKLHWHEGVV